MRVTRRQWCSWGAATAASASWPLAQAQAYPVRPVHLVVPFPPGGPSDAIARAGMQQLQEALGQPIVLDNKAGATGNVAAEFVARAPADGHTLLLGNIATNAINPHVFTNLSFDPLKAFAPVCALVQPSMCMAVHTSVPARNMAELVALARQKPGQLRYASSGIASPHHLGGALLSQLAGIDMIHVPYKGGAPATTDVAGGQVEIGCLTLSGALPFHKSGRLRILGMMETRRSPLLPDVPSIAETVKGFEMTNWQGVFAPAATPVAVVQRLQAELFKAYSSAAARSTLEPQGLDVIVGSSAEFAAFVRAEHEKWGNLVRAMKITLS